MDIEKLNNWNPWWNKENMPKALLGIKRDHDKLIFRAVKEREIVALTGIRRCGKTTIMYQIIDELLKSTDSSQILYVNLDDEAFRNETLETILNTYRQAKNPLKKSYVFLDEIQNINGFEKFLKKYYDMHEDIKFIISGSSAGLLRGEYSTLLTGRNFTFTIHPLSFREYLDFGSVDYSHLTTRIKNKIFFELDHYIKTGGFPEVYFKDTALKNILLKQYYDDILYKDVISRHNVNPGKINELTIYLLSNISNLFTIRKIRNHTGLSIDSIRDYTSYLSDAFLVDIVPGFSYSYKDQISGPKKAYCIDTGLRNISGFSFSKDIGRLAENVVFSELKRNTKEIYYWKNRGEVDFVIKDKDNMLTAINVTFTDDINPRETESLIEFKNEFAGRITDLILITKDTEKKVDDISHVPLWKWLLRPTKKQSNNPLI